MRPGYLHQGLAPEFLPYPHLAGRLAGWAYTIRGQMTPYEMGGDAEKMKACQGLTPGEVSVWSGDGHGICYFGELIAIGMKERGCTGALVDAWNPGRPMDRQTGFPGVRALPHTCPVDRTLEGHGIADPRVPEGRHLGFRHCHPGRLHPGYEDGVIVIPAAIVEQTLAQAEKLTQTEVRIREELGKGMTLAQALEKSGYV
ncbi:hypothetical protein CDEF62S_00493 [Castellaniella defragrans]